MTEMTTPNKNETVHNIILLSYNGAPAGNAAEIVAVVVTVSIVNMMVMVLT